jgi:hypothetical protein
MGGCEPTGVCGSEYYEGKEMWNGEASEENTASFSANIRTQMHMTIKNQHPLPGEGSFYEREVPHTTKISNCADGSTLLDRAGGFYAKHGFG